MTFYQVSADARPEGSEFENYAPLVTKSRKGKGWQFCGRPFSHKWKPLDLEISMPLWPRPDFFDFGVGTFVCNDRARELAAEPLEMAGELLPVNIRGEDGQFVLFNLTNCINALDVERSAWSQLHPSIRILKKPVFRPEAMGEPTLFKIPEDGAQRIYCVERTGDPEDGEFKAVVEFNHLVGLVFERI